MGSANGPVEFFDAPLTPTIKYRNFFLNVLVFINFRQYDKKMGSAYPCFIVRNQKVYAPRRFRYRSFVPHSVKIVLLLQEDVMKDLILIIAKSLVDKPDEVRLNEITGDKTTIFELHVAKDDLGKVIGKQGKPPAPSALF